MDKDNVESAENVPVVHNWHSEFSHSIDDMDRERDFTLKQVVHRLFWGKASTLQPVFFLVCHK